MECYCFRLLLVCIVVITKLVLDKDSISIVMKKTILLLLFICGTFVVNAQNESDKLKLIDKMPTYPGGAEAMSEFIREQWFYPWMPNEVNGRVVVKFIVRKDGSISDIEIDQSLNPLADSIVISIVKQMPKWLPGVKVDGEFIDVGYRLPVVFKPVYLPEKNLNLALTPKFKGGYKKMLAYLKKEVKRALTGSNHKIVYDNKRVVVRFIVSSDGKINHAHILEGLDPFADDVALRIVGNMPLWETTEGKEGCYVYDLVVPFNTK